MEENPDQNQPPNQPQNQPPMQVFRLSEENYQNHVLVAFQAFREVSNENRKFHFSYTKSTYKKKTSFFIIHAIYVMKIKE